jgi:hypothetical protein
MLISLNVIQYNNKVVYKIKNAVITNKKKILIIFCFFIVKIYKNVMDIILMIIKYKHIIKDNNI